jgi:hypothetical protein
MKPIMKNTNRVRKNGSASRAARQAKTAAKENVTIAVTYEGTDELAAKFDLPKPFFDAMANDVIAKRISLRQWIEDAVNAKIFRQQAQAAAAMMVSEASNISLMLISQDPLSKDHLSQSVARIDLTREQFETIKRRAAAGNVTLEKILGDALNQMVKPVSFSAVEMAITESNGLLQLLADNMEYQSRSGCEFSGPEVENFCAGVSLLVMTTKDRLKAAFDSAFHATWGNPKPAPAAA